MVEATKGDEASGCIGFLEIFVLSALALYLELFIIRWLGAEIQAFRVFKTFPLVGCFVGLGAGFAANNSRYYRYSCEAFLAFLIIASAPIVAHMNWVSLPSINVFVGFHNIQAMGPDLSKFLLFFIAYLTMLMCAVYAPMYCIGSRIGELMRQADPLRGYNYNLLGSIAGSVIFSVLTFCLLPPWIVALIAGLVLAAMVWKHRKLGILSLISVFLAAAVLYLDPGRPANAMKTYWSPYQRLDLVPTKLGGYPVGWEIECNHMIYQPALIAPKEGQPKAVYETLRHHQRARVLPFLLKPAPQDLLIVGAGNGYDVAEALEHGAQNIDAVDIDPCILDAGKRFNPRKPYDDPRVHQICQDARAYFNTSKKQYDLIYYAFLDSHVALGSGVSSRLDNYVFTKEGFEAAYKHLKPGGMMEVNFLTTKAWFTDRLYTSFKAALDYVPAVVIDKRSSWGLDPATILVAGDAVKNHQFVFPEDQKDVFEYYADFKPSTGARILTDDWPYLHVIPTSVDFPYLLVVFTSLGLSFYAGRRFLIKPTSPICWQLFFMGAAFFLLELQSIARLNQLYGTNWLTTAIVVNCILFLAWIGNLLVIKKQSWFNGRVPLVYGLLALSIVVSYVLPIQLILQSLSSVPIMANLIVTMLSVLPLGFAGIIFSSSLSRSQNTATALAFNLYGALIGGMFEYFSIYTGINALALIALGFYIVSLFFYLKAMRRGVELV